MSDSNEAAKQATPHALLLAELLDSRIPKSEREHAAKREIERLTASLKRANETAEHFERHWYLRGDEIERLTAEVASYQQTLREEYDKREALDAEIERLTAALRAQPGPVSLDDVEWAGKVHLAEAIRERDELRRQLDELRTAYNAACDALRN